MTSGRHSSKARADCRVHCGAAERAAAGSTLKVRLEQAQVSPGRVGDEREVAHVRASEPGPVVGIAPGVPAVTDSSVRGSRPMTGARR